jgi:hypothetical protein
MEFGKVRQGRAAVIMKYLNDFYHRCTRGSTMKRNINRDQRLTDMGSIPKEKSPFVIDIKGGEKNRGVEMKRRGMKTGGASMSMSVAINHV